ncbi:bis(5'-nucleosyl)-tetraphosphatase PrpE [Thalassobacillus sp. CUG 92003]|uniref:bis(5'-nucleosyl)-tetraphosphatase PrpE n=1 Tax=Thalassobacillus sp. CUG 92003 TaxID=2736641 RepID=UPI0015E75D72|nr:bis(5'-nucleosyl)-tetraphosphatase PrpE [Thalassobacillus sp. CUG 92003]
MKIDVIGDVHGCYEELLELFSQLNYTWSQGSLLPPSDRVPVFLGDITDRGPDSIRTIHLVHQIVITDKIGRYVPGNHCNKLYRYFLGNPVQIKNGLETTVAEYEALSKAEQQEVKQKFIELIERSPLYLELPEVNAVIAHAGIPEAYIGKTGKQVTTFVLYGDITGEKHEDGRPIRKDWAKHYHGDRWIVYGHTPVLEPRFMHKTVNIDTGCVFGNKLTCFRLPEHDLVSVRSKQPFMQDKFQ